MALGFPTISRSGPCGKEPTAADLGWVERIAATVNNLLKGKMNAVTKITLTANSATTTFNDPRIGQDSILVFQPLTANAGAALYAAPYVLPSNQLSGVVTLNHTNNAQTDRTFNVLIIG